MTDFAQLAITGKLVHAMGGVIAVDSVEGEWTEFVVELPFHDTVFDVEAVREELSSATVLIVEEDHDEMEAARKEQRELMAAESAQVQEPEGNSVESRLQYLLQKSEVFAHFLAGK